MSRASELADELDAMAERITRYTNSPGDSLCADAAEEMRRLDRVNAELVEAMTRLLQNFPTDGDMAEAGWEGLEIEAACQAYDRARATLTSATKETK